MTVIGTGFDHRPGAARAPRAARAGIAVRVSTIVSARRWRSPTTTSTCLRSCGECSSGAWPLAGVTCPRRLAETAMLASRRASPGFGPLMLRESNSGHPWAHSLACGPCPTTLRRTVLYDRHVAAGAKLVEFAGWEMPVQYEGVRREHMAVREDVGMFDVSHMGEIETSGPQALELLQRLITNDLSRVPIGGAQYGLLCREDGGVLDDLFTYRLDADRWLTVTTPRTMRVTWSGCATHAGEFDAAGRGPDRGLRDARRSRATRAWPRAAISDAPLPPRMTATTPRLAGSEMLVCGTGYTGEDGVELLLWARRRAAALGCADRRRRHARGLAARDTLRLEACYHLYGNDLALDRGPIEAGLGWCCREDTGFIGVDAVRRARGQLAGGGRPRRGGGNHGRWRRGWRRERRSRKVCRVRDRRSRHRAGPATRSPVAGWSRAARCRPVAWIRRRPGVRTGRARRAGHERSRSTSVARCAPRLSARSRSTAETLDFGPRPDTP